MDNSLCWSCGNPEICELVCPICKSLQRPPTEYFEFFGIPEKLSVDPDDLQKRFYDLNRQFHPDRYTLRPPAERSCALEASSVLNDGYRTLRDPILRAEYVLRRHGYEIGEQRSNDVPPELLEEVFELNEALEEIRGGDEAVRPHLVEAELKFRSMLSEIDDELQLEYKRFDESRQEESLKKIRATLNRRKYIQNLVSEVDKELAAHISQ